MARFLQPLLAGVAGGALLVVALAVARWRFPAVARSINATFAEPRDVRVVRGAGRKQGSRLAPRVSVYPANKRAPPQQLEALCALVVARMKEGLAELGLDVANLAIQHDATRGAWMGADLTRHGDPDSAVTLKPFGKPGKSGKSGNSGKGGENPEASDVVSLYPHFKPAHDPNSTSNPGAIGSNSNLYPNVSPSSSPNPSPAASGAGQVAPGEAEAPGGGGGGAEAGVEAGAEAEAEAGKLKDRLGSIWGSFLARVRPGEAQEEEEGDV
eukprot:jgi/Mesen1/2350/ME000156S01491